ncbi:MAG: sodium:proton antiporter NhaD [Chitinophagales bacterium]
MTGLIIFIFIAGYVAIAFESTIKINKAATALVTGVLCWTVYILSTDNKAAVSGQLVHHFGDLSQILFFLMGSMTIVELIDAHDGFEIITGRIKTTNKRNVLWIISLLTFFLSAVLNNLTTAIVMISLVRKLMSDKNDRLMFAGMIVIAANAGGVWSPIGDVTTTMLWIGNQVTPFNIIMKLILPSLVCLLVPLLIMQSFFKGEIQKPVQSFNSAGETRSTKKERLIVFATGLLLLLLVPLFTAVTTLPPFMGILIGLGLMWMITETIHSGKNEEDRKKFTANYALRKIDTPTVLFFLGILLSIAALESTRQLEHISVWMDNNLKDHNIIAGTIGLLSSIVDNVPLVAATQGMYSMNVFPTDHYFWEFLAYTTGTGGSILIIGSAAGVAIMGIEKIDFIWYLKRVGWLALLGYIAGAVVYILQSKLFGL